MFMQALRLQAARCGDVEQPGDCSERPREVLTRRLRAIRRLCRSIPDLPRHTTTWVLPSFTWARSREAIPAISRPCHLRNSDYAETWNNLGDAQRDLEMYEEAIASSQQALRLKPDFAEAHNNIANVLAFQGKYEEAIAGYRQALRLSPAMAEAHFNMSMQLLTLGHFEEGWKEYEWRWQTEGFLTKGSVTGGDVPHLWDGSPLDGRTIVLHPEQGMGI